MLLLVKQLKHQRLQKTTKMTQLPKFSPLPPVQSPAPEMQQQHLSQVGQWLVLKIRNEQQQVKEEGVLKLPASPGPMHLPLLLLDLLLLQLQLRVLAALLRLGKKWAHGALKHNQNHRPPLYLQHLQQQQPAPPPLAPAPPPQPALLLWCPQKALSKCRLEARSLAIQLPASPPAAELLQALWRQ